ncbi:MAG: tellurium resistance protein [Rhodobacteraceae bacterium]|nr:tellurium resistance protein [Paracoccaceae bacterium]
MPNPAQVPFWRRTPPAVFPPVMGLFGLGLAWRRAAEVFSVPTAVGDLILGATSAIFLVLFTAHMIKFFIRPETVVEDLQILPGRVGLAAASLCVILMAAAVVPFSERLAAFLLTSGLIWHIALATIMVVILVQGPAEQRRATPAWHLSFVGFIMAPLSAAPLGMTGLAQALLVGTVTAAVFVYSISLSQLIRKSLPPPLRPLLAIHLAPISLFGAASVLLGYTTAAVVFACIASVVLLALILHARWLTVAGFSPLWGAFTFPAAAYAGLCLALAPQGQVFVWVGGAVLVAATLMIPPIAFRVLRLFANGKLAAGTNAAIA